MTTTTAVNMSTWTGPAWATDEEEVHGGGIRWTRRPTTAVAAADEGPSSPGDLFKVEAAVYDFLTVIGPLGARRAPAGPDLRRRHRARPQRSA